MAMTQSSLPGLLQERASRQPDATAYTFIDYEIDPAGFAESLTWAQVYRGALVVAEELRRCGEVGDRAAILAPEGLGYITAFLGALQAGFIAVPLPVPQFRVHDERVSAALRDCSPSVILTTSTAVDEVSKYACDENGCAGTSVIEVDSLDLYSARVFDAVGQSHPSTAYLQYTSGSTRTPAGVIVSHRNVIANLEQAAVVYFEDYGNTPPPGLRWVSWLPFHHDMGLFFTLFIPIYAGNPISFITPVAFLQRPARWMQLLGKTGLSYSCAPKFRLRSGGAKDVGSRIWTELTSGACWRSSTEPNEYTRLPSSDSMSASRASTSRRRRYYRPTDSPRPPCVWRLPRWASR